jgi:hypothetical protein
MVEVRSLRRFEEEPTGDSWVLIEKRGDLYFVKGRQNAQALKPQSLHLA